MSNSFNLTQKQWETAIMTKDPLNSKPINMSYIVCLIHTRKQSENYKLWYYRWLVVCQIVSWFGAVTSSSLCWLHGNLQMTRIRLSHFLVSRCHIWC